MKRAAGRLRIIGGEQRRRLIRFDVGAGVRPTPDRVRQTVFDWLAPLIEGARVLDLFAGSGALGLEALSRGAASATLVDTSATSTRVLRECAEELGLAARARIVHREALLYLSEVEGPFDVVFLDPPFDSELLDPALRALVPRLAPVHRVYAEWRGEPPPPLPDGFSWLRSKQAGQVSYGLLTYAAPAAGVSTPGSQESE